MADPQKLKRFHVEAAGEDFSLHIEDETGETLEVIATREQVDLIVDDLDDLLSADDSADEVDENEGSAA